MTRTRRPSAQTLAVLTALADEPGRWRYGYDLCTQLGLRAGSMYPILMRLADRGLLETSWETERVPGRPARHLYRLTSTGLAYAETSAASAPAAGGRAVSAAAGRGRDLERLLPRPGAARGGASRRGGQAAAAGAGFTGASR